MTIETFNEAVQKIEGIKVQFLRDHTRVCINEATIAGSNHEHAAHLSETLLELAREHGVANIGEPDHFDFMTPKPKYKSP